MTVTGILMTHAVARREGKLPFFFSRFKFDRMKKMGNTHFCFACLSNMGYIPDQDGRQTNHHEEDASAFHGMETHDNTHEKFVIGNADKYEDPWSWLGHETPKNFPCVVHIPQV